MIIDQKMSTNFEVEWSISLYWTIEYRLSLLLDVERSIKGEIGHGRDRLNILIYYIPKLRKSHFCRGIYTLERDF